MKIVFVCVGTPKIKGDSVGPKVGSFLKSLGYEVYGTMQEPITSVNIARYEQILLKKHKQDFIIGIDAAFGNKEDIGQIKICENGIRPGGAYSKNNNKLGDIGVLAVVADRNLNKDVALDEVEDQIMLKTYKKLIIISEYIYHYLGKKIIKKYLEISDNYSIY